MKAKKQVLVLVKVLAVTKENQYSKPHYKLQVLAGLPKRRSGNA